MRCEICGTEHDAPGKFCAECGYPLLPDAVGDMPRRPRRRSPRERLGGVKLAAASGALLVLLVMAALAVIGGVRDDDDKQATASDAARTATEPPPAARTTPAVEEGPAEADRPVTERTRAVDSGTVQKQITINETAIDDDVTFKVTRIYPVESIPLYGTSGEILRVPGEKLVRLDVRWKNNMDEPADLWCGGARNAVLLDVLGTNYTPLRSSLDAEGNEDVCNEDVQPGETQETRLWYRLKEGTAVDGVVLWNSAAPGDPDGDETDVFVAAK